MQLPVSHYGDTNDTPFLLPPHRVAQILYLAHTQPLASACTIATVLHGFLRFGDDLDHLLQMYAPHY